MEAEVLGTVASTGAAATSETFRVGPFDDPDRYEIGEPVEAGAEGILYRGQLVTPTSRLSLPVAVKALQPAYSARIDQWAARWRDQVELLRSLQIPGLVGVREGFVGLLPHRQGAEGAGRNLYLVMNWVEGEALDHWVLRHRGVDVGNALKLLLPVAVAVDTMHGGQLTGGVPVVHRDIKPANILIGKSGSVLVDFGLTKGLSVGRPVGRAGTPGYIAPEVVAGGGYTPAADRYAFGATVFFLLTGRHPSTITGPGEVRRLLEAPPVDGGDTAIAPELVDRVAAMLDPDPDRRPAALANWIAQLRQSSLDDEALSVRLAPPAPARLRRLRGLGSDRSPSTPASASASTATTGSSATSGATLATGDTNQAGSTTGTIGLGDPIGLELPLSELAPARRSSTATDVGTDGVALPAAAAPAGTAGGAAAAAAAAHRRSGAHRAAHRPPQHARHQRVVAGRYALAVVLAVAVAAAAGDAGAVAKPVRHLAGPSTAVASGGSSAVISPTPAGSQSGTGNAISRLPFNQPGEQNFKSPPAVAVPTTLPVQGQGPCVASYLPSCGPVRWSPAVVNKPLTLKVTYSPANPIAGQTVTFTVTVDDPDDGPVQLNAAYYGDESGTQGLSAAGAAVSSGTSGTGCSSPHGTWKPPNPGPHGHTTYQESYTYQSAGTFQVHFSASSGATPSPCSLPDPYASTATSATQTVVVGDDPPPSTTTTTSTTVAPPPDTTTTVAGGDGLT